MHPDTDLQRGLPTDHVLLEWLRQAVRADGEVTRIVERVANPDASSFSSEVVTVTDTDGSSRRLFCKYQTATTQVEESHGHRGGLIREAAVYEHLLTPLGTSTPRWFGTFKSTAGVALFLEQMDDSCSVRSSTTTDDAMARAAAWIGHFHRTCSAVDNSALRPLPVHTVDYYQGWAERTLANARGFLPDTTWLAQLAERYVVAVPGLLEEHAVIHGEFYPENILYQHGRIRPVDWESAARAAGEIDLACLVEKWPQPIVDRCVHEYRLARWDGQPPEQHEHRLMLARLYLGFRYLDRRRTSLPQREVRRFDALQKLGEHFLEVWA